MSAPIPSEVVRRRADIGDAMSRLERALAKPAAPGDQWRAQVAAAVAGLGSLAKEQIAAYTADDGVLAEVVERAPRLASHVVRVRELIESLPPRVDTLASEVTGVEIDQVREHALRLLADFLRARQKLADLVWDAYSVDLGGDSS